MKPYQKRVVAEKKLLDLKRIALDEFIRSDLMEGVAKDEQFRLYLQTDVMEMYSDILAERIRNFKGQA